ncbi:PilC/PilY family type IV pilus protein [Rhodanobacter sp. DHB23]|uniref:pilus assembly protein n=1 Tax=Rhodanobacter sp. DHB23 TaxID=2775923 RepID=UPI001784D9D2|nr:PilC/PilY family type IV pilus protein [Rhodanobacter sp. DHB23]MBD8871987.1 pilus assembly protein PilY [Rhodanobacter sp. DHB23]
MNLVYRLRNKAAGFLGHLAITCVLVCAAGVGPAMADAVTVDQSPLIIQRSLPPNVVLMLDDSGSMDYDYMPDWGYMTSSTGNGKPTNEQARNSAINGTYYNPAVTYTPPPKADGTSYPNSPGLANAYKDGFRDTSTTDVTRYSSSSQGTLQYYTSFTVPVPSAYAAKLGCQPGDGSPLTTGNNKGMCQRGTGKNATYYAPNYYSCNTGDGNPDANNQCATTTNTSKYFFTYTTGSGNTRNYVGQTGDCALLAATNPSAASACSDSADVQQNVANWFSYYRKRILMAKSGLMNSFSTLDKTFRVGFGSIDGGNVNGLGNDTYLFTTAAGNSTYKTGLAQVAPFGDGSSGTQKAKFWAWVNDIPPTGSTPLQMALDAVGKYYQTDQPWKGMNSDPDYTTAAASNQLACRQSYTILTTDGFWNGSTPSNIGDVDGGNGPTIKGTNNQSYAYASALPYADSGQTSDVVSSQTPTCNSGYTFQTSGANKGKCLKGSNTTATPNCGSGYSYNPTSLMCEKVVTKGVTYSDTLADVAMKYWMTDLQPGIDNEVPTNTEDLAFWQHMTTFTLGMGFDATDGTGTVLDTDRMARIFAWANGNSSKAISGFSWPKPSSDSIANIADLAHAAVNGHGGFFSAKDPDGFAQGIKEALKRASERVGTGASLAANSTQLQTGTVAYQANYWTAKWKGDLKSLAVDSTTGTIANSPSWTASGNLPTAASRRIKTYNSGAAAGSQYVDFAWDKLSKAQQDALLATSMPTGSVFTGAGLVNYLRGDSSQELSNGGVFRNRDTPMGDIVNSQPVYVGAPNANQFYTESFTGSSAFAKYASSKGSRAGTVYVAANDGMLHGIDATSGAENFAYLPGAVITAGFGALASPDYGGAVAHGFFNDGELTVADVYMGNPAAWHTVLVGSTGRGVARAVYALDVTDPANVALLWERSAGDGLANSGYIGQMVGKPVIAQTADGTWSVLVGNGYNSTAGKSALLQFALADGSLNVHDTSGTSGLAAPAVWMDPSGNGVSTTAYAGDAGGNVWSFTLNTSTGTSDTATPGSAGVKIFTAMDGNNKAQPVTAGLLVGKDPKTGNTWVFFGTGSYLNSADLSDTSVQSWYGLIVQSGTTGLAVTSGMTRGANLVKRSITAETSNARAVTTLAEAAADKVAIDGKSGWYIDLVSPVSGAEGERMVTPSQFQGNLLLGTTRIPKASDPCNPSGKGWIMAVDPFTGTNPSQAFFDVNGDGKIDADDLVDGKPAAGLGFSSLPNNPIFVGSSMLTSFDNGSTSSTQTSSSTGVPLRVSWRELIAH